jgi:hypothetical protein
VRRGGPDREGDRHRQQAGQVDREDPEPAAVGAALSVALAQSKGKTISVMMAYADRLEKFVKWYAQLWAESLGKNGKGSTPIGAVGPVASGLGRLLLEYSGRMQSDMVFATVLAVILEALALLAAMQTIEKRLTRWAPNVSIG